MESKSALEKRRTLRNELTTANEEQERRRLFLMPIFTSVYQIVLKYIHKR